jgi:hypothetical protein
VHVASIEMPCVRTLGHIGAAHIVSVLGLPPAERETALIRASRDRLSVRELRRMVVSSRRAEGERRGRPTRPSVSRVIPEIEGFARRLLASFSTLPPVEALDPSQRDRLDSVLAQILEAGAELRRGSGEPPAANGKVNARRPHLQRSVGDAQA